jgi:hypothetical protein
MKWLFEYKNRGILHEEKFTDKTLLGAIGQFMNEHGNAEIIKIELID